MAQQRSKHGIRHDLRRRFWTTGFLQDVFDQQRDVFAPLSGRRNLEKDECVVIGQVGGDRLESSRCDHERPNLLHIIEREGLMPPHTTVAPASLTAMARDPRGSGFVAYASKTEGAFIARFSGNAAMLARSSSVALGRRHWAHQLLAPPEHDTVAMVPRPPRPESEGLLLTAWEQWTASPAPAHRPAPRRGLGSRPGHTRHSGASSPTDRVGARAAPDVSRPPRRVRLTSEPAGSGHSYRPP
jgi:hypothetical protein